MDSLKQEQTAKLDSDMPKPLERSTLETYAIAAITIFIVVWPMSWFYKVILLIAVAVMATDYVFRSRHTIGYSRHIKLLLSVAAWLLIAALSWEPTRKQYQQENMPTSELRIQREQPVDFKARQPAALNIFMANDSQFTIHAGGRGVVAIIGEFGTKEKKVKKEEELWKEVEKEFYEAHDKADPKNSFYAAEFPPKVETLHTLQGKSPLTNQEEINMRNGNGFTNVFFMVIFSYDDASGEHGLEYCVFTQGRAIVRCETGHNGPTAIKQQHWWQRP